MQNEFEPMYGSYVGIALKHSIRIPSVRSGSVKSLRNLGENNHRINLTSSVNLEDVIGVQGILRCDTEGFVYLEKAAFFADDKKYLLSGEAGISKSDISAIFQIPEYEQDRAMEECLRNDVKER